MTAQILSLGEIDRIARMMIVLNAKLSTAPMMLLIEASRQPGWQNLAEVCRKLPLNPNNMTHVFRPLLNMGLVKMRKRPGKGSRFAHWELKVSPALHVIPDDSYDSEVAERLLRIAVAVMEVHRKMTPLLILVLIAVLVRKMDDAGEVRRFCGRDISGKSSTANILNVLAEHGVVQLVKLGNFRRAPVKIFEVETA